MVSADSCIQRTTFHADAAIAIKATEDIVTAHADFPDWCQREYANATTTTEYECKRVNISPLKYLYASEFDVAKSQHVVTELKKKNVLDAYKKFGRCFDFPIAHFGSPAQAAYEGEPAAPRLVCICRYVEFSHYTSIQSRVIPTGKFPHPTKRQPVYFRSI